MEIPEGMTVERALELAAHAESERAKWMTEAQRYRQGLEAVLGRLPESVREEVPANRKPEETAAAVDRLLYRVEVLRRAAEVVGRQYREDDPTVLEPASVAALRRAHRDLPVRNW